MSEKTGKLDYPEEVKVVTSTFRWSLSLFHCARMQLLNTGGGHVDTKATHQGFRYKFYAINFSCAGIIILFSSYTSAFWILVHGPDFKINIGLWSICEKREVLTCQSHVVLSTVMLVTRFLMTFSTIFGLIAATFALLTNSSMRTSRWPFIANSCTALTLMGTMIFFGSSVSPQYLYGEPAPDPRLPITSAWGIYTGYLACLLFSLSAFMYCLIEVQRIAMKHNPKAFAHAVRDSGSLADL